MKPNQTSVINGVQNVLIPMENFNCTQGDFEGNHPFYACDMAGKDTGQELAFFPFDAICKATNHSDGNAVWYQSVNPVRFADGTINFATIMILHDNDLDGVVVGKIYKQGTQMAREGSKMGNKIGSCGNHLHFEIAKGNFSTQYARNTKGYYLPNGIQIEKACFADGTTFINSSNWGWKYTKDIPVANGNPVDNILDVESKFKFAPDYLVERIDVKNGWVFNSAIGGWIGASICREVGSNTDQVFYPNEHFTIDGVFTVSDVNIKANMILCKELGYWIKADTLTEV